MGGSVDRRHVHPSWDPDYRLSVEYRRWRFWMMVYSITTYTTWVGFPLAFVIGITYEVLGERPPGSAVTIVSLALIASFLIWIWAAYKGDAPEFVYKGQRMRWKRFHDYVVRDDEQE